MSEWLVNGIGAVAGVLGTLVWLPQLSKIWRSRETRDLSLASNLLLFATIAMWTVYAFAIGAVPMIVSNLVGGAIVAVIIGFKLRYG